MFVKLTTAISMTLIAVIFGANIQQNEDIYQFWFAASACVVFAILAMACLGSVIKDGVRAKHEWHQMTEEASPEEAAWMSKLMRFLVVWAATFALAIASVLIPFVADSGKVQVLAVCGFVLLLATSFIPLIAAVKMLRQAAQGDEMNACNSGPS